MRAKFDFVVPPGDFLGTGEEIQDDRAVFSDPDLDAGRLYVRFRVALDGRLRFQLLGEILGIVLHHPAGEAVDRNGVVIFVDRESARIARLELGFANGQRALPAEPEGGQGLIGARLMRTGRCRAAALGA